MKYKNKLLKSKIKKAASGLQDITVPQQGSPSDVLSATTTGASAGSIAGPIGIALGGLAGLAGGLLNSNAQTEAYNKAIAKNKYLKANRAVDGIDNSLTQAPQRFSRGGRPTTRTIEIEGKKTPEIHTDKNFNVKNLGTTPHSRGGNKVEAEEGDIVFNTQNSITKFNKVASAIKSGDKKTLRSERDKLPEDKTSKMQQGVKGTKKKEPDYMMEEEEREAKGLPARNPRVKVPVTKTKASKPNRFIEGVKQNLREDYAPIKSFIDYQVKGWTPHDYSKDSQSRTSTAPSLVDFINNKGTKSPADKPFINSIPVTKPKSTVNPGVQGKRISGSTARVNTPKAPQLTTNFGPKLPTSEADINLLKDNPTAPFIGPPKPTDGNYNPTKTGVGSLNNPTAKGSSNVLNNALQFAGVANNLFQGLKAEPTLQENYISPQLLQYTDRSQALRNRSNQAVNAQIANARNLSGGNGANIRSNAQAAQLANFNRQQEIDEREQARADAINTQNIGLQNNANEINAQRRDNYQQIMMGNRAAKEAFIGQAASDLGKYGMLKQQENYMRSRDALGNERDMAGLNALNGSSRFNYDVLGNQTFNPYGAKNTFNGRGRRVGLSSYGNLDEDTKDDELVYKKGTRGVKLTKLKQKKNAKHI